MDSAICLGIAVSLIIIGLMIWSVVATAEGYSSEYILSKWNIAPDILTFEETGSYSVADTDRILSQSDADELFDYNLRQAPFYYNYLPDKKIKDSREKSYLQRRALNCSYPDYSWM